MRPVWAEAADAVLQGAVSGQPRVPGVAAVVVDASGALWQGAAGVRVLGEDAPMTAGTVLATYSVTKLVTAVAAVQLVEQGRLDLDAPAARHAPELAGLQVLEGFGDDGTPRLRPPRTEVTTRMLLLHTAGFGYDFYDPHYRRLADEHGQPGVSTATRASLRTPLLFDPGSRWQYGSSTDWAGQVVEGVAGRPLGDVLADGLLGPLGMSSTGFVLTEALRERAARVHVRTADGGLRPLGRPTLPAEPEVHMGGQGLWSPAEDLGRLLQALLAGGGGVLRPESVALLLRSGLDGQQVRVLPGLVPAVSPDLDPLPGVRTSWSFAGLVNTEPTPTGRSAGSVAWAGLANLYWWLDPVRGLAGFWATQVLPFLDPTSYGGALALEEAVLKG